MDCACATVICFAAGAEYQEALWRDILHRGSANVRANKERRTCNRNEGGKGK